MALRKVTAIIRTEVLEEIEQHLEAIGVPGISVTYVKGFGNYANFFKSPPLVTHARIEIFIEESRVKSIVDTIMECAHTGRAGDGIIAVLPVEQIYKISRKAAVDPSER